MDKGDTCNYELKIMYITAYTETSKVDETCSYTKSRRYVSNFSGYNNYNNRLPEKLIHDESCNKSEEKKFMCPFTFEVEKILNEGTYQSTVIVLTIRAVLKNLSFRPLSFISSKSSEIIKIIVIADCTTEYCRIL
ncbi:hypothetical protein Glove_122g12 [Diversispora epigaea]|uniref:Uncharacterized protein n=1 Tax=Diversispora epigaea TaxID=1348612 RepID=A0A397J5J6_9GLOM|nr:hypothetical protein Glove_122g12 [Diversispora epigaea]